MAERLEDLVLHPVRLRVVILLVTERRLTPQQLSERMPDVPSATLYRHINKLTTAGVLVVVEQRQVRGAQQKVYALADDRIMQTRAPEHLTREGFMRHFVTFIGTLLGSFGRYLQRDRIDPVADGISFRQASIYATDEEFLEIVHKQRAVLYEAMNNGPAPGRHRRSVSIIFIPEDHGQSQPENQQEE